MRAQGGGEPWQRSEVGHPHALHKREVFDVLRKDGGRNGGHVGLQLPPVIAELLEPAVAPGLGVLGLPDDAAAGSSARTDHPLNDIGAADPFGNRRNLVLRKGSPEHGLQIEFGGLALGLLGALLGLSLQVLDLPAEVAELLVLFQITEPVLFGESGLNGLLDGRPFRLQAPFELKIEGRLFVFECSGLLEERELTGAAVFKLCGLLGEFVRQIGVLNSEVGLGLGESLGTLLGEAGVERLLEVSRM